MLYGKFEVKPKRKHIWISFVDYCQGSSCMAFDGQGIHFPKQQRLSQLLHDLIDSRFTYRLSNSVRLSGFLLNRPGLCRPQYDTTVQFVVEMDTFLAEHKDSGCLTLALHRSTGYDHEPLGAACIPLPHLLDSLHLGPNAAKHSPCQRAQVTRCHLVVPAVWDCCCSGVHCSKQGLLLLRLLLLLSG